MRKTRSRLIPRILFPELTTEPVASDLPFTGGIIDATVAGETVVNSTTETSILKGSFLPPAMSDRGTMVIRFEVWYNLSTDAAAGSTTYRFKLNGSSYVGAPPVIGESNLVTGYAQISGMCVVKNPNNTVAGEWDVAAYMMKLNATAPGIYTNPINVNGPAATGLGPVNQPIEVEFTLQTSDAGTTMTDISGYIEVIYGRDDEDNTTTGTTS